MQKDEIAKRNMYKPSMEVVLILQKLLNGFLKERLLRLGWALGQAQ